MKFKNGIDDSRVSTAMARIGSSLIWSCEYTDFVLTSVANGRTVEETVGLLANNPLVEYAEPNYIFHAAWEPNDPLYVQQWHLDDQSQGGINMESAWDIETGDPGVVVAVIDSGVAYENFDANNDGTFEFFRAPDLANTTFVPGWDFVNGDSHPNDDRGHGTHVAGTIAQSTNNSLGVAGVAFGCAVMPVKVLGADGGGNAADLAAGINWAVANGADVINMSLTSDIDTQAVSTACQNAYNAGVVLVAAAGNDFLWDNSVMFPAAHNDWVIAVGATRIDRTRAPYSNTGAYVDVVAPGGDTAVDQNGDGNPDGVQQQTFAQIPPGPNGMNNFEYRFLQGTSMATPHVSGVAALIISRGITDPDIVRERLEATALDLGSSGRDDAYGWGLIDANAAIQTVVLSRWSDESPLSHPF